jgi:AcrR family transcriptional regulator
MDITKRPSARQRILDTAAALFYSRGINNTGIDRIIADAGVAKASMYNHFASKEEIVATYLRGIREQFGLALTKSTATKTPSYDVPFRLLKMTLANGDFYGCPFSNALVELPDSDSVKQEVTAYRNTVLDYFELAVDGDAAMAAKLMVVYDGAFLNCKLSPSKSTVENAIEIAELIVSDRR